MYQYVIHYNNDELKVHVILFKKLTFQLKYRKNIYYHMGCIFVAKLLPLISSNIIFPRLDDKEKYTSNNISVENGKA